MTKKIFIFFAALFTAVPAGAYSDCYRACMDASGCWSPDSGTSANYCSGVQARCSSECRDQADGGGKIYGAIAYSKKDGAYGYSHGWQNREKAEKVALKNCFENGKDCRSEIWFYNGCGSVAADGRNVGSGFAPTGYAAAKAAVDDCKKKWFSGKCEEVVTHCSGT